MSVVSLLCPFERQRYLSFRCQEEIFCVKKNRHRCVFAWRHLEAGQHIAQSGLHLHQSEPHSCENIRQTGYKVCSRVSEKPVLCYSYIAVWRTLEIILEIWQLSTQTKCQSYLNVTDTLEREWHKTKFLNDLSVLKYCVAAVDSSIAKS
jgi:hypothetical protein